MCMYQTICSLRNAVIERLNQGTIPTGFKQVTDVQWTVRHPTIIENDDLETNHEFDAHTWEIGLYRNVDIGILLQFMLRGNGENNPQRIIINGNPFACIKLFIYDNGRFAGPNGTAQRQDVRNRLNSQFPQDHRNVIYGVQNGNTRWGQRELGHICDLYILNSGKAWNIQSNDNPNWISDPDTTALINKVVTAAKDIIKAAGHYADNRTQILTR